jgi:hypothetical protein
MRYAGKWMGMGHHYTVSGMVNLFLTLAETLLLVRVIVKFFFTTAGGGFIQWVSQTTDVLLAPFRALYTNPTATPGNWHVDWVALFAMAVYAAFGSLLIGLASWNWGNKRGSTR